MPIIAMKTVKVNKDNTKASLLITGGSGFLGGNLALMASQSSQVYATYLSRSAETGDAVQWLQLDVFQ